MSPLNRIASSVLYVEDDPVMRQQLARLLERNVASLYQAKDGLDGLRRYEQVMPDIVLTDISMPVMDGLEMARRIRELNPKAWIVAISAHSDTNYLLDAISLGLNGYVLKPIDVEQLRSVLAKCDESVQNERKMKLQDKALSTALGRLQALLDNLHDGVLFEDEARRILFVNKRFCELFGIPVAPEALIGGDCVEAARTSSQLFRDPAQFLDRINDILARRENVLNDEITLADGRVFERDYSAIVVDKKYRGNLWKYRDVSQRKHAENMSRTYAESLEQLLVISRSLTSTTDLKKLYHIITHAAAELLRLDYSTLLLLTDEKRMIVGDAFGFPEEIIGRQDAFDDEGLASRSVEQRSSDVVLDYEREMRFPVPAFVREFGIRSALAVPMVVEDGVVGVLIGHSRTQRSFSHDEITLYQNIGNQAAVAIRNANGHAALSRAEKKLRDIANNIAEGIYVLNRDGQITFMNPEAERLFGWTQDELNEGGAHNLVHPVRPDGTHLPAEECRMHQVVFTGMDYASNDEVFVRRDGTTFPVSVITTPILDGDTIVASVTAFRDITEEKQLEQEALKAQKLEAIGLLAGGIAHDFNNLLQAIVGYLALAKMRMPPTDKAANYLTQAEESCKRATELSNRLLTFSRGGDPIKQKITPNRLLKDTIEQLLKDSSIKAQFNIQPDLHVVNVDELQLRQVFRNITINAIEAMPNGGTLRVSAENRIMRPDETVLPAGRYVHISVRDNGVGVAQENLSRVYEPYYTTKPMNAEKGTGLGLTICYSIMKKHAGAIMIDSSLGEGTTVHLYLPAVEAAPTEIEEVHAPSSASLGRVLIMDDDEQVLAILKDIIEYLGYEVICSREGSEAVELYRRFGERNEPIDCVLLDLTIHGGIGGRETLRKLREINPGVRAIASSGDNTSLMMKEFKQDGFVCAIAKPYTAQQLEETLRTVCSAA